MSRGGRGTGPLSRVKRVISTDDILKYIYLNMSYVRTQIRSKTVVKWITDEVTVEYLMGRGS